MSSTIQVLSISPTVRLMSAGTVCTVLVTHCEYVLVLPAKPNTLPHLTASVLSILVYSIYVLLYAYKFIHRTCWLLSATARRSLRCTLQSQINLTSTCDSDVIDIE